MRMPVRLGEETIAWVEKEESLLPLLQDVGLLALVSGLFSIAASTAFAFCRFRVLDRAFERIEARNVELQTREPELRSQYMIRDAAGDPLGDSTVGFCPLAWAYMRAIVPAAAR